MKANVFDEAKNAVRALSQAQWQYMDMSEAANALMTYNPEYFAATSPIKDHVLTEKALARHFSDEQMQPMQIPVDLSEFGNSSQISEIIHYALETSNIIDPKTRAYSDCSLEIAPDEDIGAGNQCVFAAADTAKIDFEAIMKKIDHLKTIAPKAWRTTADKKWIFPEVARDNKAVEALEFLLINNKKAPSRLAWVNGKTGDAIPIEKSTMSTQDRNIVTTQIALDVRSIDESSLLSPAMQKLKDELDRHRAADIQRDRAHDAEYRQRGYRRVRIYEKDSAIKALSNMGISAIIERS